MCRNFDRRPRHGVADARERIGHPDAYELRLPCRVFIEDDDLDSAAVRGQ